MSESYNPLSRIIPGDPAQADAWNEACRVAQWLKERHPGCTVRAFGSLVRPNAWSPRSDIDLAVSGVADFSWQVAIQVHDEFTKYEVQVVSTDFPSDTSTNDSESAREFIEEILATGVEIPAPFKAITCKSELAILGDRLEKVAKNMGDELKIILELDLVGIPASVEASAVMAHIVRYRLRLEKGLSRVLGFIDRLEDELEEGDERLRLYETAMQVPFGVDF
jgi:predicted nucleotidyltransferase